MPDILFVFMQGDVTTWVKEHLRLFPVGGQNRYFGKVFMGFIINKKGVVIIPHVIWTSGHSGLDVGNFVCRCRIIGIEIRPVEREKGGYRLCTFDSLLLEQMNLKTGFYC